jgi:hypothetical protein
MKEVRAMVDELAIREERVIAQHGWAIRGVFASDDGSTPEFAYTVGLHDRGCPELITFGVQYRVAGSLLNELAGQLVGEGMEDFRLVVGPRAMEGWPVKFYILPCDPSALEDDAAGVLSRSGGQAKVAQVCWSDEAGNFPWEHGFDARLRGVQPVLGAPPGAAH